MEASDRSWVLGSFEVNHQPWSMWIHVGSDKFVEVAGGHQWMMDGE